MEMKNEVVNEAEGWAEFDKDMDKGGKYVKLEVDKPYKVVISKAELGVSDKYKDKYGNPKREMKLTIVTLNGEPCGKEWNTSSWSVMKEVRKAMKDGSLARSVFLVKKKQEGDSKSYIFEKLEEFQAPAKAGEKSGGVGAVAPSPHDPDFARKYEQGEVFL